MYDDHYWMSHIGDPTFEYHVALTPHLGYCRAPPGKRRLLPLTLVSMPRALEQFLRDLEQEKTKSSQSVSH